MKRLIVIAIILVGFSGCIMKNNVREEIGSWVKVSIEKEDGLVISKDVEDVDFKWSKDGETGTITEFELEKYFIKNILIGK